MKTIKWLFVISVIAIILLVLVTAYSMQQPTDEDETPGQRIHGQEFLTTYQLPITTILIIVALIPILYYLIYKLVEHDFNKNMDLIQKTIQKTPEQSSIRDTNNPSLPDTNQKTPQTPDLKTTQSDVSTVSKTVIMKFLSYNEKKVIATLIDKQGTALQSEISRTTNMSKVKTHRAIKDLQQKGIIKVDKYGKTNKIQLTDEIKQLFLE